MFGDETLRYENTKHKHSFETSTSKLKANMLSWIPRFLQINEAEDLDFLITSVWGYLGIAVDKI